MADPCSAHMVPCQGLRDPSSAPLIVGAFLKVYQAVVFRIAVTLPETPDSEGAAIFYFAQLFEQRKISEEAKMQGDAVGHSGRSLA